MKLRKSVFDEIRDFHQKKDDLYCIKVLLSAEYPEYIAFLAYKHLLNSKSQLKSEILINIPKQNSKYVVYLLLNQNDSTCFEFSHCTPFVIDFFVEMPKSNFLKQNLVNLTVKHLDYMNIESFIKIWEKLDETELEATGIDFLSRVPKNELFKHFISHIFHPLNNEYWIRFCICSEIKQSNLKTHPLFLLRNFYQYITCTDLDIKNKILSLSALPNDFNSILSVHNLIFDIKSLPAKENSVDLYSGEINTMNIGSKRGNEYDVDSYINRFSKHVHNSRKTNGLNTGHSTIKTSHLPLDFEQTGFFQELGVKIKFRLNRLQHLADNTCDPERGLYDKKNVSKIKSNAFEDKNTNESASSPYQELNSRTSRFKSCLDLTTNDLQKTDEDIYIQTQRSKYYYKNRKPPNDRNKHYKQPDICPSDLNSQTKDQNNIFKKIEECPFFLETSFNEIEVILNRNSRQILGYLVNKSLDMYFIKHSRLDNFFKFSDTISKHEKIKIDDILMRKLFYFKETMISCDELRKYFFPDKNIENLDDFMVSLFLFEKRDFHFMRESDSGKSIRQILQKNYQKISEFMRSLEFCADFWTSVFLFISLLMYESNNEAKKNTDYFLNTGISTVGVLKESPSSFIDENNKNHIIERKNCTSTERYISNDSLPNFSKLCISNALSVSTINNSINQILNNKNRNYEELNAKNAMFGNKSRRSNHETDEACINRNMDTKKAHKLDLSATDACSNIENFFRENKNEILAVYRVFYKSLTPFFQKTQDMVRNVFEFYDTFFLSGFNTSFISDFQEMFSRFAIDYHRLSFLDILDYQNPDDFSSRPSCLTPNTSQKISRSGSKIESDPLVFTDCKNVSNLVMIDNMNDVQMLKSSNPRDNIEHGIKVDLYGHDSHKKRHLHDIISDIKLQFFRNECLSTRYFLKESYNAPQKIVNSLIFTSKESIIIESIKKLGFNYFIQNAKFFKTNYTRCFLHSLSHFLGNSQILPEMVTENLNKLPKALDPISQYLITDLRHQLKFDLDFYLDNMQYSNPFYLLNLETDVLVEKYGKYKHLFNFIIQSYKNSLSFFEFLSHTEIYIFFNDMKRFGDLFSDEDFGNSLAKISEEISKEEKHRTVLYDQFERSKILSKKPHRDSQHHYSSSNSHAFDLNFKHGPEEIEFPKNPQPSSCTQKQRNIRHIPDDYNTTEYFDYPISSRTKDYKEPRRSIFDLNYLQLIVQILNKYLKTLSTLIRKPQKINLHKGMFKNTDNFINTLIFENADIRFLIRQFYFPKSYKHKLFLPLFWRIYFQRNKIEKIESFMNSKAPKHEMIHILNVMVAILDENNLNSVLQFISSLKDSVYITFHKLLIIAYHYEKVIQYFQDYLKNLNSEFINQENYFLYKLICTIHHVEMNENLKNKGKDFDSLEKFSNVTSSEFKKMIVGDSTLKIDENLTIIDIFDAIPLLLDRKEKIYKDSEGVFEILSQSFKNYPEFHLKTLIHSEFLPEINLGFLKEYMHRECKFDLIAEFLDKHRKSQQIAHFCENVMNEQVFYYSKNLCKLLSEENIYSKLYDRNFHDIAFYRNINFLYLKNYFLEIDKMNFYGQFKRIDHLLILREISKNGIPDLKKFNHESINFDASYLILNSLFKSKIRYEEFIMKVNLIVFDSQSLVHFQSALIREHLDSICNFFINRNCSVSHQILHYFLGPDEYFWPVILDLNKDLRYLKSAIQKLK